MDSRDKKHEWMAVPQFGAWDSKQSVPTDYSMVFSKARANRKHHKSDARTASLGNEKELLTAPSPFQHSTTPYQHSTTPYQHEEPPVMKKTFLTYINCCIRP